MTPAPLCLSPCPACRATSTARSSSSSKTGAQSWSVRTRSPPLSLTACVSGHLGGLRSEIQHRPRRLQGARLQRRRRRRGDPSRPLPRQGRDDVRLPPTSRVPLLTPPTQMPCRRARRGDRQVCRSLYDPRRAHPAHSLRLIHAVALYLTHSFPFSCAGRARFAFLFPQPSTARARPPPPPMAKKDLARFLGPARALIFVCTYPHARPTMQPILLVCSPRRIFDSKTYIQASWITAPRASIVHPANQSATS